MTFQSFDTAVDGFCQFLASSSWPTSIRWLVRSRARWNRRGLYVYKPNLLIDSTPHQRRLALAIERNKNVAFIAYAKVNGTSLVGLETSDLDPPHNNGNESGSHNYKTLESPLKLISVDSPFVWRLTTMFVRNSHPFWNHLGWPS